MIPRPTPPAVWPWVLLLALVLLAVLAIVTAGHTSEVIPR